MARNSPRLLALAVCAFSTVCWCPVSAQESLSFRDDFTGTLLAPEFRVFNPDKNRMALVDGEYVLLLTHPDSKNWIVYMGKLPINYSVNIRVSSLPQYAHQGLNLTLGEGENYMNTGLYLPSNFDDYGDSIAKAQFYTAKYIGDESSNIFVEVGDSDLKPFYLRVTKNGVEYTSDYSFDGARWFTIGTHVSVQPYTRVGFGVWTWGGSAPESPVRIDSFEVVDLSEQ